MPNFGKHRPTSPYASETTSAASLSSDQTIPLPTRKNRLQSLCFRTFKSLLTIYIMVTLVISLLQTKLIFPGAQTQGQPDAIVTPPPDSQLINLTTANNLRTVALFGPATLPDGSPDPLAPTRPTLLYFYGNGMCLRDTDLEFRDFRRLGANVLIVEYLGYGMAGGEPGESGCYAAAEAGYQHLLTRTDIDTSKIIPAGWSLGAAVAIDLAHKHRHEKHIAGLITFSSFTNLSAMAKRLIGFLPVDFFLKHRFDSDQKMREGLNQIPILIGHGRQDSMIPFSMREELIAAARASGSNVTDLAIDDADHNDFFATGEERVLGAMQKFIRQIASPTIETRTPPPETTKGNS